jgi:hypothetical protein
MFRVGFWRRGGFRRNSCDLFDSKISNEFSSKVYCDGAATLHRWREGAAELSTILETAVRWRLQLYLNFGRKIVADFSTQKNSKCSIVGFPGCCGSPNRPFAEFHSPFI